MAWSTMPGSMCRSWILLLSSSSLCSSMSSASAASRGRSVRVHCILCPPSVPGCPPARVPDEQYPDQAGAEHAAHHVVDDDAVGGGGVPTEDGQQGGLEGGAQLVFISHSYCPPSRSSIVTMRSSWLWTVKKWHSWGVMGPPSLRQVSWGRGLPPLRHSSTAVTPTLTTLPTIGSTNQAEELQVPEVLE